MHCFKNGCKASNFRDRLYKSVKEYDVLLGIFSGRIGTQDITKEAVQMEARGDYYKAVKLYNQVRERERESMTSVYYTVFIIYLVRYMYNVIVKTGCFFYHCRLCLVMIGMKTRPPLK